MRLQRQLGGEVDYTQAVSSANGQATRSDILEHLVEVGGNVTHNSLDHDLHYLLRLSASYIIHFPIPLRISQLLTEIIDKNTLNHNAKFLSRNPLTPQQLVANLETSGQQQLVIAGGAQIYTDFMQLGLIDEMYLTIEPVVFGSGVRLFSQQLSAFLELVNIIDLSGQTKVLHYKVTQ